MFELFVDVFKWLPPSRCSEASECYSRFGWLLKGIRDDTNMSGLRRSDQYNRRGTPGASGLPQVR